MKRHFLAVIALGLCLTLGAQTTSDEFQARYLRQVNRLGYAGVGVEGIIDKWEAAFPDDGKMLEARYNYYFVKGLRTEVVRKDVRKYLGADPVVSIPDSTGASVNYFSENFFDEEMFANALTAIDKAIALYPNELLYRVDRISGLFSYEKESPDLSLRELTMLVSYHKTNHPQWTIDGAPASEADFVSIMAEYCVRLYNTGDYEAFRALSQVLSKTWPKDPDFLNNIGSYWLVARQNDRKAASYYKKALKLDPDNVVAARNLKIIERRKAAAGKKSK